MKKLAQFCFAISAALALSPLFLLAQDAVPQSPIPVKPVFNWENWLLNQGPLYGLYALVVYFTLRYGPGLVESHKNMMDMFTTVLPILASDNKRLKVALIHLSRAGQEATTCDDVKKCLAEMHRVLAEDVSVHEQLKEALKNNIKDK